LFGEPAVMTLVFAAVFASDDTLSSVSTGFGLLARTRADGARRCELEEETAGG
jgi:hypothetical protein